MSEADANGVLLGIARRDGRRQPMQLVPSARITTAAGLIGDSKGARFPRRQITVLALEDWEAALADVGADALAWTARRANLLVGGVRLPRAKGAVLRVGGVDLEVTGQTYPCRRMEEVWAGLLKALAPAWRGGVTTRVLTGGEVAVGVAVAVIHRPPDQLPLPLPP